MATNTEKAALRKMLLEKRDSISYDLIKITSKQIHNKLKRIKIFKEAESFACYYPIGSEVLTQDIMQEILSDGKEILLPKIKDANISFRKILDLSSLEKGSFDIMEPKDDCPVTDKIDVVLVPTVGISPDGIRLGYGHGYYDRFLAKTNAVTIALTYSKQIIKSIPFTEKDIKIQWIVTEEKFFQT